MLVVMLALLACFGIFGLRTDGAVKSTAILLVISVVFYFQLILFRKEDVWIARSKAKVAMLSGAVFLIGVLASVQPYFFTTMGYWYPPQPADPFGRFGGFPIKTPTTCITEDEVLEAEKNAAQMQELFREMGMSRPLDTLGCTRERYEKNIAEIASAKAAEERKRAEFERNMAEWRSVAKFYPGSTTVRFEGPRGGGLLIMVWAGLLVFLGFVWFRALREANNS